MGITLRKCESYYFLKSVRETIVSNHMVSLGDKVLIAVSGGPDSMALLHAIYFLSNDCGISLGIAHINHMIRGSDSEKDELFVKSIANGLNIPFYSVSADILRVKKGLKLTTEEASRKVRYAFFKKIMNEHSFNKVALAHHMEDNAELILMFMLRGSGLTGLSGMLPVRENRFIRPFIRTRKFQILKFLLDENFKYVEDKSNNDIKFTRNKIRHLLVPFLSELFNPKIVDNLNRIADVTTSENEWIDKVIRIEYNNVLIKRHRDQIYFSATGIARLHLAIQRRLIRRALFVLRGSLKGISFVHVESVIRLLKDISGTKHLFLPDSIQIIRIYDKLIIKIANKVSPVFNCNSESIIFPFDIQKQTLFPFTLQDNYYRFEFFIIRSSCLPLWSSIGKNAAFLDLNFIRFPITIRYVTNGDKVNPLGMRGSQTLKKYFINKKIPLLQRSTQIVVEDNGRVVWLVAHTICDYAKVTEATKDVLMIKFYLLKVQ